MLFFQQLSACGVCKQVDNNTLFSYHQEGDVVWATYKGGAVRFGTLTAKVLPNGHLVSRYVLDICRSLA